MAEIHEVTRAAKKSELHICDKSTSIIQSWTFKTTRTLHVELFPKNLMR